MPNTKPQRLKSQTQVTDKETFDFSVPGRNVNARAVDPYVQQGQSKAKNIMAFADQMSGVVRTAGAMGDMVAGEQREKGKAARGREEKAPENAHWAFLEGYENMSGQAAAYDYENELSALFENSWRDDPETFNAKKDALAKKYLNGATDAHVKGFVSRGMAAEASIDEKYQKQQHKIMQEDFLTKSMKVLKMDFKAIGEDDSITEKTKAQRASITKLQGEAAAYGLSKSQMSEAVLKTVGSRAAMTGHPEDMGVFLEPDNGIAINDNPQFTGAIAQYIEEAVNTRQSLEKEARLERERVETKYAQEAGKVIIDSIEKGNPLAAHDLLEKTGHFMKFDMYKGLKQSLLDMREGSDTYFAPYTDQTSFDILRTKARYGNLTMQELESAQGSLNKTDYRTVFGDMIHNMDRQLTDGRRASKKSINETTMERTRTAGATVVAQKDTLDRLLNPETAPLRKLRYEIYFGDLYNKAVDEAGGRAKLTPDQMTYASQKAIWLSFQDYAPRNEEKMPPDPDSKTKPDEKKTASTGDDLVDYFKNQ